MSEPLPVESIRTAIQTPDHLLKWLEASGRRWLVFSGVDIAKGLPWPHGHEALQQIIDAYRDHRRVQDSGHTEVIDGVAVPVMKTEMLEIEELDRAIRYLIGQATEKDPTWKLENPPL